MKIYADNFGRLRESIINLPNNRKLKKSDLLVSQFRLFKDDKVEIFYVPFDYVNKDAVITLIGITPGWTQMQRAFSVARSELLETGNLTSSYKKIKTYSSFSGQIRSNIISMLDDIGLDKKLKLDSCEQMFKEKNELMHTTSAVRYAVFRRNDGYNNYSGGYPNALSHLELKKYIQDCLAGELKKVSGSLIIPLGKAVTSILRHLVSHEVIQSDRCLWGFPHPSGANGHRLKQFENEKEYMIKQVDSWKTKKI